MVAESAPGGASQRAQDPDLHDRARERLERLQELPSHAGAVHRALRMLDEPLCTNRRLVRVLTSDQAAVAGLLRLANSAYFGVPREISELSTAIRVVGYRRLRTLLCHLLAGKLLEILHADVPAVDEVRRKALAAAVGAEAAAAGDNEELRVAGLLHNVGELALAAEFPDQFCGPADAVQTFGVSYEKAGATLLRAWCLPESVVLSSLCWRSAPYDGEANEVQRAIDAVHLGGTLAEAWIEGATAVTAAARVSEEALARLRLSQARAASIFQRLPRGVQQLDAILA
jgi:HD-like signal output (HDOD) protein